jgi:hypothetical protein
VRFHIERDQNPTEHHTCFLPRWLSSPRDLLPSILTPRPTQQRKGFTAASPRRVRLPSPHRPRQPDDSPHQARCGSPPHIDLDSLMTRLPTPVAAARRLPSPCLHRPYLGPGRRLSTPYAAPLPTLVAVARWLASPHRPR